MSSKSRRKRKKNNVVTQQQRVAKRMEEAIRNQQPQNIEQDKNEKLVSEKVKETSAILQEYYDNKPEYTNEIRRGDVFFFDKNSIRVGVEQDGGRPGIIVSNDYSNRHSEFVEVVYCTTQPKKNMITHIKIPSMSQDTTALCEQVHTLSKKKIVNRKGRITDEEMQKINKALLANFGLKAESDNAGKLAELDAAISKIEKAYSEDKIMKLGEEPEKQQEQNFDYKAAYENLTGKILNITLDRIMEVKK